MIYSQLKAYENKGIMHELHVHILNVICST